MRKAKEMSPEELLSLMRLLSALETATLMSTERLPDHLYEELTKHVEILEREILKGQS